MKKEYPGETKKDARRGKIPAPCVLLPVVTLLSERQYPPPYPVLDRGVCRHVRCYPSRRRRQGRKALSHSPQYTTPPPPVARGRGGYAFTAESSRRSCSTCSRENPVPCATISGAMRSDRKFRAVSRMPLFQPSCRYSRANAATCAHAAVSRSRLHAALAGLVDGRHWAGIVCVA